MKLDGWIGNRSRLPLPVILSARSQLLSRAGLTSITVLALAASVGLAASVEMATRSVRGALSTTMSAIAGSAEIEISAGAAGVPEALLEPVREQAGVRSASPIIQETFRVATPPFDGLPLRVLAIDLLYEHEVRHYQIEQGGFVVRDPLRLVAVPGSIVVSETLAVRLGLREGDPLPLRSSIGAHEFVVRGILRGELADAYSGQIAVTDVFGLQELLGYDRRVDRIDVALEPDASESQTIEALSRIVGEGATVRRAALREIYFDSIMETLNIAVWITASIGILLSLFLVYAVISLSVDRRLEELSLLRAAGMSGRSVTLLILTDALLLATLGAAIGLTGAIFLSDGLVGVLSRTSEYLQHVVIEPLEARWTTYGLAFAVALPVSLLAAIEPAVRAGRRSPVDVLRGYRIPPSTSSVNRALLGAGAAAAVLSVGAWVIPEPFPGPLRLLAVILFGVVAVGAAASQLLLLAFPLLQRVLGAVFPRVGYLVGSTLLERPVELGATIAVWAGISGGLLTLATMTHSVSLNWDEFLVGLNGPDAVLVFAQDPLASRSRELLRRPTLETLRSTPGVRGVAEYYRVRTLFRGEEVTLSSRSVAELVANSGALGISRDPPATIAALSRGELAMNPAFARYFGVEVGDSIVLVTARGPRTFRVGSFARGFAGPRGELYLDTGRFREFYDTPGAVEAAIWIDAPREATLAALQTRVEDQALFFRQGELFRNHTQIVIARFNDLLMLPAGLITTIGVVALLNLLLGNVLARRRDLAILRGTGATPGNIRAMLCLNAVLVGAIGTGLGILLSLEWSRVATHVVADALGYDIDHRSHAAAMWVVALGALLIAGLAGLAPTFGGDRSGRGDISSLR